ncbi:MAG: hypothetical protein P0S96_02560 [Simkaniaceae bacterium]|nr:hypothetical protein [Candidatus Sacchlamyda saccharinae]
MSATAAASFSQPSPEILGRIKGRMGDVGIQHIRNVFDAFVKEGIQPTLQNPDTIGDYIVLPKGVTIETAERVLKSVPRNPWKAASSMKQDIVVITFK